MRIRMLGMWWLTVLCITCAVRISVASDTINAKLSLQEQIGVKRVNEPVRMGIPLAKGVAQEASELVMLSDKGERIPCQFTVAARWLEDKSIKWVHALFQADVDAGAKAVVKLAKGMAGASGKDIVVQSGKNAVTIQTSQLRLVIKGDGFNLFDSATVLGANGISQPLIESHQDGFVATINGRAYRPSSDSIVSVVEQGAQGAVVRVCGKLVNEADAPFTYICYVHVYRDSPIVNVDFSYVNASGLTPTDYASLEDLSLVLPTTLKKAEAKVGGEDKIYSGKAALIVAKSSDIIEVSTDGAQVATSKGKSTKPYTIGWGGLQEGNQGLSGGLRWFWQMHPRAVEVTTDGKLRLGLFAKEAGDPLNVYMGQGRTHYITLVMGAANSEIESRTFAGSQMPLRAVCESRYYCRDTQVFGPIVDADAWLLPTDVRDKTSKYNSDVKEAIVYIDKKIDGQEYNGVTKDSYGYYAWGDLYHWANAAGVEDKWNLLWESNYYDYPFATLLQFARTGDLQFLDICDRNGLHVADVFMCKWHPNKELIGACRYSPPANHVGLDTDYRNPKPYVSEEFNHHKAQSILYRYLLLGDLHAKDDFMLALNNATLNREGAWHQCRGAGAKLATLTEGYQLVGGDDAIMKMMRKTVTDGIAQSKKGGDSFSHSKGRFMYGIATEGLVRYYWLTKDQDAIDVMTTMNDWLIDENLEGASSNSAMSMAFLWRHTGDAKYRDAAIRLLNPGELTRPKSFGQSLRSMPYALYYLSDVQ